MKQAGGSKWLAALSKEKDAKIRPPADPDKQARIQRLAALFHESSEDEEEEKKMDLMAAGDGLNRFLKKVDHHLEIEKVLIDEWANQPNQL